MVVHILGHSTRRTCPLTTVVLLESLNLAMELLKRVTVLLSEKGNVLLQLEHLLAGFYPATLTHHLPRINPGEARLVLRESAGAPDPTERGPFPAR